MNKIAMDKVENNFIFRTIYDTVRAQITRVIL